MTEELAPGQLLAGKYRIERELGRGGMGAVYLAENVDLGRRVAIKVLLPRAASNPEMTARFRQEARAAAAIGHPGIVDVLDLGRTEEGAEFIVMEHLQGEPLTERLSREGALALPAALEILEKLTDALAAAHEHGIVHRDLKPDNIFLVERPVPGIKILDFGISKLAQSEHKVHTVTGTMMGTPQYMSPEQVTAARDVGPAADLYALGVIAYEMLAGHPPYRADSLAQLVHRVVSLAPPPLAGQRGDLPPGLSGLVMQLLAKSPAARPGSAGEVLARIRQLSDARQASGVEAIPPNTASPEPPPDLAETLDPFAGGEEGLASDGPFSLTTIKRLAWPFGL